MVFIILIVLLTLILYRNRYLYLHDVVVHPMNKQDTKPQSVINYANCRSSTLILQVFVYDIIIDYSFMYKFNSLVVTYYLIYESLI